MAQSKTQGPTVTLRNKSRQMLVLNLPYQILGAGYMRRQVVGSLTWVADTQLNGQVKRARGGRKRLSESMRLMGKGRKGDAAYGLPPAIVRCPDVAGAIKAGDLIAEQLNPEQSAKQARELEAQAKADEARAQAKAEHAKAKRQAKIEAELAQLEHAARPAPAAKPKAKPKASLKADADS